MRDDRPLEGLRGGAGRGDGDRWEGDDDEDGHAHVAGHAATVPESAPDHGKFAIGDTQG